MLYTGLCTIFVPCYPCMLASEMNESCCVPMCIPNAGISMRAVVRSRHNISVSYLLSSKLFLLKLFPSYDRTDHSAIPCTFIQHTLSTPFGSILARGPRAHSCQSKFISPIFSPFSMGWVHYLWRVCNYPWYIFENSIGMLKYDIIIQMWEVYLLMCTFKYVEGLNIER